MADSYTELTPAELDRIEDALEGLGDGSGEAPVDLPPKLRAHLDAYREVLVLSREALPLVEVPDGLLDAVLAEARAAAPEPAEPIRERGGAGLWERLRRSFVLPGFALAATAAVLVVILRPDRAGMDDMSEGKAEAPAAAASEAAPAPTAAAPALTESAAREGGAVEEEAAEAAPAEPATVDAPTIREEKAKDAASAGGLARPAKPTPAPAKKSKSSRLDDAFGGDAPASAPADAKKAETIDQADKASVRELLDKADKLRRRGRCDEASAVYRQLEGIGGTSEAQALVGLGLCAEFVGESNAAGVYFQRARKLAAVDGLIATGRKQMEELGAAKKKSKADFGE